MEAMTEQSKRTEKPKFLLKSQHKGVTEFDMLHSYKQKVNEQMQAADKPEKKLVVEEVIEKKEEVAEGKVSEIEKRIEE